MRATQSDNKIFREVNALSRLSHRFIVRYYTTWVESSEPVSTTASSGSTSESEFSEDSTEALTSVPRSDDSDSPTDLHTAGFNGRFSIDLEDLDEMGGSSTRSSFPSIHFGGSASSQESPDDEDNDNSDPFGSIFAKSSSGPSEVVKQRTKTPPITSRTLYIQMAGLIRRYCGRVLISA